MTTNTTTKPSCPACGDKRSPRKSAVVPEALADQVRECRRCEAIFTIESATIYLGDSYGIVLPYLTGDPEAQGRQRYYDLMTLGSAGLKRRHGWFDPETRQITQVG